MAIGGLVVLTFALMRYLLVVLIERAAFR